MRASWLLVSTLVVPLSTGCGSPSAEDEREGVEPAHWTYAESATWDELDPDYAACGSGTHQSPVDLAGAKTRALPDIAFNYRPSNVQAIDTGHAVQVDYEPGNSIELNGETYDLLQFHIHEPAEHLINGHAAAAEIHLVHANAAGELAVVGVLIEEGAPSDVIGALLDDLPEDEGDTGTVSSIDAEDLLPSTRTTYRYTGSLTTPPCSEGVTWLVMTAPVTWSAEQLEAVAEVHDGNNRPVQALNGRREVIDES